MSALEGWGCEVGRARGEGAVGSIKAERIVGGGGHLWNSVCECT